MSVSIPMSFRMQTMIANIKTNYLFCEAKIKKEELPTMNKYIDKLIIIIDDDDNSLYMINEWLTALGGFKNVVTYSNPEKLIEDVKNGLKPDLVISDIELSKYHYDGFILQAELKKLGITDLIFLTAYHREYLMQLYKDIPCIRNKEVEIFFKPFDHRFFNVLKEHFEKKEKENE